MVDLAEEKRLMRQKKISMIQETIWVFDGAGKIVLWDSTVGKVFVLPEEELSLFP